MPDEPRLREQARAAVKSGKVPARAPDRTWGGPGVGAACSVCHQAVGKDELEVEIQFAHEVAPYGLDKFHVHIRCFAAWEGGEVGARRGSLKRAAPRPLGAMAERL